MAKNIILSIFTGRIKKSSQNHITNKFDFWNHLEPMKRNIIKTFNYDHLMFRILKCLFCALFILKHWRLYYLGMYWSFNINNFIYFCTNWQKFYRCRSFKFFIWCNNYESIDIDYFFCNFLYFFLISMSQMSMFYFL